MPTSPAARALKSALLAVGVAACARGGTPASAPPPEGAPAGAARGGVPQALTFDATPVYRQMGLIARGFPMPVLGRAAFVASASAETTHVVVALAFASTSLTFAREADDRFRANYAVTLTASRGNEVVARSQAEEQVLVGSFRETARTEETVIYQDILDLAPGEYSLAIALRDLGSQRAVEERVTVTVPRFDPEALSPPMPVSQAELRRSRDALPNLLLNPSGAAVMGQDSVLPVYLESYGPSEAPVRIVVSNDRGRRLWSDTVALERQGAVRSGIVPVPVARLGVGVARLTFVRDGLGDSASTFVIAGFGSDLPVASYDDMVSYLRHFALPTRLERLRAVPEEERPAAWAAFVKETDSTPATPEHEELRAYLGRVVRANPRFREEATPGYLTDRGRVFISLGEPDHIVEPGMSNFQRGRQQLWEYRVLNLQLVFYDQTGTGRWRLTQSSEMRFESEYHRRLK